MKRTLDGGGGGMEGGGGKIRCLNKHKPQSKDAAYTIQALNDRSTMFLQNNINC